MNKKVCEKCLKEFKPCNYNKHIKSCGLHNPTFTIEDSWKISDDQYQCPYCNKIYSKYGLVSHISKKHFEYHPNIKPRIYSSWNKGLPAWNRGLTKETDDRVKKYSESIQQGYNNGSIIPTFLGKTHKQTTKDKLSKYAKDNNIGGGFHGKQYIYQHIDNYSVYMDSSYEVKTAEILDYLNIKWTRPKPLKWLDSNNEYHNYFPDFYLVDYNIYLDPKNNYLIKLHKEKIERVIEQNNIQLKVLSWDMINNEYLSNICACSLMD